MSERPARLRRIVTDGLGEYLDAELLTSRTEGTVLDYRTTGRAKPSVAPLATRGDEA